MTYPTINKCIAALANAKSNFRTLLRVDLLRDENGDPIFHSSSRSVVFAVRILGVDRALRIATRSGTILSNGVLLKGELLIDGVEYCDVWVEEPRAQAAIDHPSSEAVDSENLRAIERDGRWGFEDLAGRQVVDPIYDRVEDFAEGRAVVELGGYSGLMDTTGRLVVELLYDEVSYDGSHLCYVERQGLSGVLDRQGNVVVETEWDWVSEFSRGLLLVERDELFGYVDMKGRVVIETRYENATSFDENDYATVTLGGRSYQIDKEQNRV